MSHIMDDPMEGMPPERAGPTFEDLTFDDSLDDMQRIARYATSAIALQRLVHVKLMGETAQAYGFASTRATMFPLLEPLVNDEEFVLRQHLAEQLRGIAEVCIKDGAQEGYTALLNVILPAMARLVADGNPEVRIAAGEALVCVAALVRKEDLGPRVLTIVLQLAHDDEKEDLRMTAAVLLNELAETLGPELCHQFVTPELICLAEDPVFRVRKAAALNIDAICRTVGPSMAMKRLVPAFLRLAADDIWGVRKACASSLVSVSKCLEPQVRVAALVPVFEAFAADPSKWVRNEALKHLGPFLATLPGKNVTPALLSHFTRIALPAETNQAASGNASGSHGTNSTGQNASPAAAVRAGSDPADAELVEFCSFSFPAVVFTLGRSRWSELRALFNVLSRDPQRKVRRPLAHALHEIAKIIGPEAAEADLLPAFDLYLKDVDEVKVGIVRHLAIFLSALSPATRESYLPLLDELLPRMDDYARIVGTEEITKRKETLNWRLRKLLAGQLPQLSAIFSPAATFSVVTPFALRLLADPVAAVREEAVPGMAHLVNRHGETDASLQLDLILRLLKLSESRCFRERLLFVHVCHSLGDATRGIKAALFGRYFLPRLVHLAQDRVRNVRLSIAKLFSSISRSVLSAEPSVPAVVSGATPNANLPGAGAVAVAVAAAVEPQPSGASTASTSAPSVNTHAPVAAAVHGTTAPVPSSVADDAMPLESRPFTAVLSHVRQLLQSSSAADAPAVPSPSAAPLYSEPQETDAVLTARYPLPSGKGLDDDAFPLWARANIHPVTSVLARFVIDRDPEVLAALDSGFVERVRQVVSESQPGGHAIFLHSNLAPSPPEPSRLQTDDSATSAMSQDDTVAPAPIVLPMSAPRRRSESLSPPPPPAHVDVRQVFDDGLNELAGHHGALPAAAMLSDEDGMAYSDADYVTRENPEATLSRTAAALAAVSLDSDVDMRECDGDAPNTAGQVDLAPEDAEMADVAIEEDVATTTAVADAVQPQYDTPLRPAVLAADETEMEA